MKFRMTTVDKAGKKKILIVSAEDEKTAIAKAKANEFVPYAIELIDETPAPQSPPPLPSEKESPTQAAREQFLGPHTYQMVQIPPEIGAKAGSNTAGLAANSLQEIVNRLAARGWEFYRIDPISVRIPPGCLGAFLGTPPTRLEYHVITFRMRANGEMNANGDDS